MITSVFGSTWIVMRQLICSNFCSDVRSSAEARSAFHHFPKFLLQEWLSNERIAAALSLAPSQNDHLESFAHPHRGCRQFTSVHSGHVDVGDEDFDPHVIRELL